MQDDKDIKLIKRLCWIIVTIRIDRGSLCNGMLQQCFYLCVLITDFYQFLNSLCMGHRLGMLSIGIILIGT